MPYTPYVLLGSQTLNSTSSTMSVTIDPKRYLIIEGYCLATLILVTNLRLNNDSSGVDTVSGTYSYRISSDGGADTTSTNRTQIPTDIASATPIFFRIFINNFSSQEKLITLHSIIQNTAGAGTAPSRNEIAGKWANTSAQITEVDLVTSTSTFASGSTLTVWGNDMIELPTDAVVIIDTISKQIGKAISDSISINDTISKSITKAISDTLSITDNVITNVQIGAKNVSDSVSISDAISATISHAVSVSDTMALSDLVTFSKQVARNLTDSPVINDVIAKNINKNVNDSINVVESIYKGIIKTLQDNPTLSDTIQKNIAKNIIDSVSLVDITTFSRNIVKYISDNLSLGDSLSKQLGKIIQDNVSISDSIQKVITKVITDNLIINDSLVANVSSILLKQGRKIKLNNSNQKIIAEGRRKQ